MSLVPATSSPTHTDTDDQGALDLRRMAQITHAKPNDHAGQVVIAPNSSFDLDATIFGAITSPLLRYFQTAKLGVICIGAKNQRPE
jgi:hypothetical protein